MSVHKTSEETWRVKWRDKFGKQYTRHFRLKGAADRFDREIKDGRRPQEEKPRLTFVAFSEMWLKNHASVHQGFGTKVNSKCDAIDPEHAKNLHIKLSTSYSRLTHTKQTSSSGTHDIHGDSRRECKKWDLAKRSTSQTYRFWLRLATGAKSISPSLVVMAFVSQSHCRITSTPKTNQTARSNGSGSIVGGGYHLSSTGSNKPLNSQSKFKATR